MQRWQQKQRQRIHDSIIQNARPTINMSNNTAKSRQKNHLTTSRSKQLKSSYSTINQKPSFLPFVKILELFQLQKYSALLIQHGFPHKLADKKSMHFIDDILENVDQSDQERFLSLMNTLTIMSKDLQKTQDYKKPSQNYLRKQKSSKISHYPPPPSTGQARKSHNNLNTTKKSEKNTLFKVRQTNAFKNEQTQPFLSSKFCISRPSKSIEKVKEGRGQSSQKPQKKNLQFTNSRQKVKKTPSKTPKKVKSKAYDDSYITHAFKTHQSKGIPQKLTQSNKIVERLMQKLKKLNPIQLKPQNPDEINLELEKIKKMYLSFDSATLTSNISNIDLQETIDCFVQQVYSRIDQKYRKKNTSSLIKINNNRSYLMKKRKPTPVKKYIQLQNKQQIEYLLKQSLVIQQTDQLSQSPLVNEFNPQIILNRSRQRIQTEDIIHQSINVPNQSLEGGQDIKESYHNETKSISVESSDDDTAEIDVDFQIQSFVEDFTCFDSLMRQSLRPLEKQDIKNFVQLVVMAGKMEKEMPIIAYMYIKKLLNTKKPCMSRPKLTLFNWKNIVLITLISASKIWDDTSLQNHSFSKVLKPYTTYEINRLQKYFLFYIDYLLTIDQKQYCQSYFELRKHSKTAHKTAHLMSLDLKTIQVLQGLRPGIKKKQLQLKEYYRKKMDKSF